MNKYAKLALSIGLDAIGMITPFFFDIAWAPLSAFIMTKLYPGKTGKIGGLVSLVEEAIPGLDFIPTFTITWVYTYLISQENKQNGQIIEVK